MAINPVPHMVPRPLSYDNFYHNWDCWRVTELVKAIAITVFSAFTALMFSRGREVWTSAITGKDIRLINIIETVNREHKPLRDFWLSKSDLRKIMPYLEYVDFQDFKLVINYKLTNQEIQELIDSAQCLKQLYIAYSNITSLKIPSTVEKIDINACNELTNLDLSTATSLTHLKCLCSSSVRSLDLRAANELIELNCRACYLETLYLSNDAAITKLDCSWNLLTSLELPNTTALTELSCTDSLITSLDLRGATALTKLNCKCCRQLERIDLPNTTPLTELDCCHCTQLTTINPEALPQCQELNYIACPRLILPPQLPQTATVYSDNEEFNTSSNFIVDLAELDQNPMRILLQLGHQFLLEGRPFPKIVFENSPGVDEGGLRRHLVSTLFEKLIKDRELFDEENQPILAADSQDQNKIDCFRTIGRLFAMCLNSSLLTGPHFDKRLFTAILWIMSNSEPQPDHFEERIYCQLRGIKYDDFRTFSEEERLSYITDNPIVYPAILIAKEMRAALLQSSLSETDSELQQKIQGTEVTAETLLAKTVFKQASRQQRSNMQTFFRNWVENPDTKPLVKFVKFATGSQSLGNNNITIELYPYRDSRQLPISHSCFNFIEMPIYPNQEKFNDKVKQALDSAEGFQLA